LSSLCQVSSDLADAFCALYDRSDRAGFRRAAERWHVDAALRAEAAEVERAALEGRLDVAELCRRCQDDAAPRYAAARGLDAALAHVNPASAAIPPAPLEEYALRYAETGRLDTGARGGGLLPRFVRPGREGQLPDELREAFTAVVRVPGGEWEACAHVVLPPWARLQPPDRERGLRIATTPLIADPDELEWRVLQRAGLRFYRISPADRPVTRDRIARIVAGFDERSATIALAPELCLTPALLQEWQTALAERPAAADSALRLVLVGTGNVDDSDPPGNTAVLLDGQTGEQLARQGKVYPFNLRPGDLDLWGLDGRLPAPIDEDLWPAEAIAVIEAGGARLAILVCEDLARLAAFSPRLCAHGVSHILVPVFARPTKDRRWERARAETYSDSTGSSIVVANSLVVATLLDVAPAGVALAVAPGAGVVGRARRPDDVVVFTLRADGPTLSYEPVP
jgi:predicted amidohydrolase